MFRSLACLSLIVFVVVIGSGSASAQVQITLGQSTDLATFIRAAGPQLNLQLGTCSITSCPLSFPANSNFSINGKPSSNFGSYTLTTGNAPMPFLTQTSAGSGVFNNI